MEVVKVVYKTHLRCPGELEDLVLNNGDSFPKELRLQSDALNHLTGLESYLAERRLAISPRTLVQKAIAIRETLGIGRSVVREHLNDRKAVLGSEGRGSRMRSLPLKGQMAGIQKKQHGEPRKECLHPHRLANYRIAERSGKGPYSKGFTRTNGFGDGTAAGSALWLLVSDSLSRCN